MSGKKFFVAAFAALTVFMGSSFGIPSQNINVNGANRNMLVYAPTNIEKDRPLIIQMHGMNQDAPYQHDAAKWEEIADTARFVVVFPNGENKSWDISGDKDVNFLKAIINEMYTKYGIDKKRVYVSGFSMGGMMSYHAANKMSDQIAAIAPVSGYPVGNPAPASKRMMPILHTHGTTDPTVNYNSAVSYLKRWVEYEGCSSNSEKISQYPVGKTTSAASMEKWSGCKENSDIRLISIKDKGHWYSMDLASVNTSDEIWNFVKRFSLDGAVAETPAVPPFVEPTNRDSIYNGGFDSTANAWTLQNHGDSKSVGSVKDGKYVLDISAVGSQPYTVQLIQHNLHLEQGEWYKVSFEAGADADRVLEVNVEQHEDPWDSYLTAVQNFDVSTSMQPLSFYFQMTAATDTNARLSFNAATSTGTLMLDNVSIEKVDENDVPMVPCCETAVHALNLDRNVLRTYEVYGLSGAYLGKIDALNFNEMKSNVLSLVKKSGVYMVRSGSSVKSIQVGR